LRLRESAGGNELRRIDDKGDIYAEGVDELLYGRLSNVL
jgi:hypothetical protein